MPNPELTATHRARPLRDHRSMTKICHHEIGVNARVSGLDWASAALKLPLLDEGHETWRAAGTRYALDLGPAVRTEIRPVTLPDLGPSFLKEWTIHRSSSEARAAALYSSESSVPTSMDS